MTKPLHHDVSSRDHLRGAKNADTTVVTYGDFECPNTRTEYRITRQFLERYPARLRFVFRHFPLKKQPHALAAEAAEAAADQDALWPFADTLFEHQSELSKADLEQHARSVGLDLDAYRAALASRAPHRRVQASLREALNQGLTSIPSLFPDGELVGYNVRKPLREHLTRDDP